MADDLGYRASGDDEQDRSSGESEYGGTEQTELDLTSSTNPFASFCAEPEDVEDEPIQNRSLLVNFEERDLNQCFGDFSEEFRRELYGCSDTEDRLHIALAVRAFRVCTMDRTYLDVADRPIDPELFVEMLKVKVCDASEGRFYPNMGSLEARGGVPSFLTVLDLTDAIISARALHIILMESFELELLILDGVHLEKEAVELEVPLTKLRSLSLTRCTGLNDQEVVAAVVKMSPNVVNLDVSDCDITDDGMTLLINSLNPVMVVFAAAELGFCFNLIHLDALSSRCRDLESLNISCTQAAQALHHKYYMGFAKLEELFVIMQERAENRIAPETLQDMCNVKWLKLLYLHGRITGDGIRRYAPWEVDFRFMMYRQLDSDRSPANECKKIMAQMVEGGHAKHQQMGLDYHAVFSKPLH